MQTFAILILGGASLGQAVTHKAIKNNVYFEDDEDPIIVGRMSDVENAIGTTYHSIGHSPIESAYPDEWKAGGIKWFRSYINWEDIEPKTKKDYVFPSDINKATGVIDPDRIKTFYQALKARGIQVYVTLLGGNRLYGPYDPVKKLPKYDPLHPELNFLSPEGYADFCRAFVNRYKEYVDHWELGNEPHNYGFYEYFGGNQSTGDKYGPHYAAYFNLAAQKIREVQPTAKILTAGEDDFGLPAVDAFLPAIAANANILSIHPYVNNSEPTPEGSYNFAIKPYLELSRKHKIPEVWITEVGWKTEYWGMRMNPAESGKWTSEIGQAKYLSRSMFFYPIHCRLKVFGQFCWSNAELELSMDPMGQATYGYLHQHTQNSDLNVSLTPFKGTSVQIDFATKSDAGWGPKIEKYLLLKSAKKLYLVFWIKKTQEDTFPKKAVKVRISFPKKQLIASVYSNDPLTGNQSQAVFSTAAKNLQIQNTWVSDYPNLVEITLQ
jgi:hypothetical protein